ncbi:MAG: PIN domain-containing protein [Mucilaginibacter sp.]
MLTISNPTIVTKEVAVTLLDATTKPVIFWDTCSLLDIIRLPIPDRNHEITVLEKVMMIRQKISGGDIISLASVLTVKEFNDHVSHWQSEVVRAANKISQEYNKYLAFVKRINPAVTHLTVDLSAFNLEVLLNDIVQDIAVATSFIDRDDLFTRSAETRVINKIPPANKKGEFKDAYIWTTCLTVRQMSQKTGAPFGFLSSNVQDYSELPTTRFDPYLAAEASAADILYYSHFNIAFGELKRASIL